MAGGHQGAGKAPLFFRGPQTSPRGERDIPTDTILPSGFHSLTNLGGRAVFTPAMHLFDSFPQSLHSQAHYDTHTHEIHTCTHTSLSPSPPPSPVASLSGNQNSLQESKAAAWDSGLQPSLDSNPSSATYQRFTSGKSLTLFML